MTIKYQISEVPTSTEQDYSIICTGINEFAKSLGLNVAAGSFFFAVYDENKSMIAAISGFDNFGQVEIGGLWVHEKIRDVGYGKALVQKAEDWGRSKGCGAVTVFTLKEWPACGWYQKIGFTIEFERSGHANNMIGCYLIKRL